jgi:hypothetical protein
MATINKSLTTYLPAQSVEWLESYCLDYKHLQNKDGNPKLGTAIADIIARLADSELVLPEKIEHESTAPIQYGTELETLKGEVEELKKLVTEYGTSKLPATVLDLETVKHEIEVALEPINESLNELETYTRNQLEAMRQEIKQTIVAANSTNESSCDDKSAIPIANNETPPRGDTNHTTPEIPNIGFKRVLDRLDREPELKARITTGLEQSLSLKELGQWLADGGFLNKKGENHGIDACSQFKRGIEYLNAPQTL